MPHHSRHRGSKPDIDGGFACALAVLTAAGLLSALIDGTLGWSWLAGEVLRQLLP